MTPLGRLVDQLETHAGHGIVRVAGREERDTVQLKDRLQFLRHPLLVLVPVAVRDSFFVRRIGDEDIALWHSRHGGGRGQQLMTPTDLQVTTILYQRAGHMCW